MIGHVKGEPLSYWRWNIIYYLIKPFARFVMLSSGVILIEEKQRSDLDYRKYLGPYWKATFEGAGV